MKWTRTIQNPVGPKSEIRLSDDLAIHVTEEKDGRRWQYLHMSFGEFTNDSIEECEAKWPAVAIAKARKRLDMLEQLIRALQAVLEVEEGEDQTEE